jgi:plasmid stabilization system protein ParE
MKIVYSPRAIADLRAIFGLSEAPQPARGQTRPRCHPRCTRATVPVSPCGTPQTAEGLRKIVTRKYPYLIYYTVGDDADEVLVIAIQHAAQEREFNNQ